MDRVEMNDTELQQQRTNSFHHIFDITITASLPVARNHTSFTHSFFLQNEVRQDNSFDSYHHLERMCIRTHQPYH